MGSKRAATFHPETTLPAPPMSDAQAGAVTAELVACTLGARRRPELRTDMPGKINHAMSLIKAALARTKDQSAYTRAR